MKHGAAKIKTYIQMFFKNTIFKKKNNLEGYVGVGSLDLRALPGLGPLSAIEEASPIRFFPSRSRGCVHIWPIAEVCPPRLLSHSV